MPSVLAYPMYLCMIYCNTQCCGQHVPFKLKISSAVLRLRVACCSCVSLVFIVQELCHQYWPTVNSSTRIDGVKHGDYFVFTLDTKRQDGCMIRTFGVADHKVYTWPNSNNSLLITVRKTVTVSVLFLECSHETSDTVPDD